MTPMNSGRPLQYDPGQVLEATMQAFWRRGYEGTSLQHLLVATRLSKSSFYQAFGSKHDAFQRAIDHYVTGLTARLRDNLLSANSGWDFLRALLLGAADEARTCSDPLGCMIVNVANEFSGRDPQVRAQISAGVKSVTQVLVAAVKRAQREGSVAAAKDAQVLGRYLLSSLSGLRTMAKAGSSHRAIADVVEIILLALK